MKFRIQFSFGVTSKGGVKPSIVVKNPFDLKKIIKRIYIKEPITYDELALLRDKVEQLHNQTDLPIEEIIEYCLL